jgi:hypothetical protein
LKELFDGAFLGLNERIGSEALARQLAFDATGRHELQTQINGSNLMQQCK